jgi:hypothetical protein
MTLTKYIRDITSSFRDELHEEYEDQCVYMITSPRTQEFVEESQQQKLLVGLLVIVRQVHPNIDGGHGHFLEIDLFRSINPN